MKVAILGAPTSGKTVVGRRLTTRLNKNEPKSWTLIDGYIEKFCTRTGNLSGLTVYSANLQLITERLSLEQEAEMKRQSTITCGSIYESLIYTGILGTLQLDSEQARVENYLVAQSVMTTLGYLERMIFDYDALFFIPFPDEKAEEHTWDAVVNSKIPEVLEGLFKMAVTLIGTPRQQVDHAYQIIQNIQAAQNPPAGEVPAASSTD